jgi:DNA-binding transcriptional LysR family regulator
VNGTGALLDLVQAGLGVGIVPRFSVRERAERGDAHLAAA